MIKSIINELRRVWKRLLGLNLAEWYTVLKKCRVSVISAGLVVGVFRLVPQAQDVLRSMSQRGKGWELLFFELFLGIWAIIVWYGARFILDQDFEAMRQKKKSGKATRTLWGETFMPRFLGAVSLIGLGIAMKAAVKDIHVPSDLQGYLARFHRIGSLNIILGVLFYILFKLRNTTLSGISSLLQKKVPNTWLSGTATYIPRTMRASSFSDFPAWLRRTLWACLIASLVFWASIFVWLQDVAPFLGTGIIILLGFVFISIFGVLLVWLGERTHLPMIVIVILIAGVFGLNDNHAVRSTGPFARQNLKAKDLYESWLTEMDVRYGTSKPHPIFFVAAAGGGIKAAYWTASVLGALQDQNPSFAEHTIISSTVSGGSLGSATFASLVANGKESGQKYEELAQELLSRDFLSPAIGSLLFHDLPAWFWPLKTPIPDRAQALEEAWERAWISKAYLKSVSPPHRKISFKNSFSDLVSYEREHVIPTLLLNGTSVETGHRILTTHIDLGSDFTNCKNVFDIRQKDINLSTAVMLSARFTFVSPAGTLAPDCHVVDGGYYENSGSATALQFIEAIEPLIKKDIPKRRVIPIFIQIDNDYVTAKDGNSLGVFPELVAPIEALLNTRNAHADSYEAMVKSLFEQKEMSGKYYVFTFSTPGDVKAPLGWYLSLAAQRELQKQLHDAIMSDGTTNVNVKYLEDIGKVFE